MSPIGSGQVSGPPMTRGIGAKRSKRSPAAQGYLGSHRVFKGDKPR
jgi:hypothetical protein